MKLYEMEDLDVGAPSCPVEKEEEIPHSPRDSMNDSPLLRLVLMDVDS